MYNKVLIPLDGSKEAEGVFRLIRDELAPDGEVILIHVIVPRKARDVDGVHKSAGTLEDEATVRAMEYLRKAALGLRDKQTTIRYETVIGKPVVDGIVDFARTERVDLIAMYTHDRKGIARFIQFSVAKEVSKRTKRDVKIFKPEETLNAGEEA